MPKSQPIDASAQDRGPGFRRDDDFRPRRDEGKAQNRKLMPVLMAWKFSRMLMPTVVAPGGPQLGTAVQFRVATSEPKQGPVRGRRGAGDGRIARPGPTAACPESARRVCPGRSNGSTVGSSGKSRVCASRLPWKRRGAELREGKDEIGHCFCRACRSVDLRAGVLRPAAAATAAAPAADGHACADAPASALRGAGAAAGSRRRSALRSGLALGAGASRSVGPLDQRPLLAEPVTAPAKPPPTGGLADAWVIRAGCGASPIRLR